jgi:hypothetical protein
VPATCGVAIEVPLKIAKPPPGIAEVMEPPGARKLMNEAALLKVETVLFFSVLPTANAEEMQPGELIELADPLLPAAMMVAMPAEPSASIADL